MTAPSALTGFGEIAANYTALLCDIWGVLHNGRAPFDGVAETLQNYRAQGGKILLVSNAPRPAAQAAARLHDMGFAATYDDILTSGDATRAYLGEKLAAGARFHFVGPDKDADLIAGLPASVALDKADFVLFSGPRDDAHETPDDYADMLAQFKARELPLICPNPDRMVHMGGQMIYCGGAIAEAYEAIGGAVVWIGKPHPPIYARAKARLSEMGAAERVLAVGDGAQTDILGANQAGLDTLFITGGLAAAKANPPQTPAAVATLLAESGGRADYFMQHFIW